MARTVHIIGAGLAGLAAAVELTRRGERVVVHEATQVAGGRARSYPDASLGMMIDNGNHLLLLNRSACAMCARSARSTVWPAAHGAVLFTISPIATSGRCASWPAAGFSSRSARPDTRPRLSAAGAAVGAGRRSRRRRHPPSGTV
jgi:hypothetical protein